MTQKRIAIILHAADATLADWVITSETGEIIASVRQEQLSNLSAQTKDADVIVIVPAEDVLLTETTLPKLSRHKLLQALPYALEEQLIDEVSDLHFAIGVHNANGTLPVAVVAKTKMQYWLDSLKTAGIEPTNMISMIQALPLTDKQCDIYSFDNIYMVRTGKYSGFAADADSFEKMLTLYKEEHPEVNMTSQLDSAKNFMEILAFTGTTGKAEMIAINLLQTPYATKRKLTRTKNVWKFAAYFAAAWMAVVVISNVISFFILHYQSSHIENKIQAIYMHHFPHATSMVAPRERMEQKLKEMTAAAQKNNFLSLLATVGKSLSKTTGIHLQHMEYRSGILTLEISSAAFDNVDSLISDLNTHGLTVKQQNSASAGSQVKATLLINAGGAV